MPVGIISSSEVLTALKAGFRNLRYEKNGNLILEVLSQSFTFAYLGIFCPERLLMWPVTRGTSAVRAAPLASALDTCKGYFEQCDSHPLVDSEELQQSFLSVF